MAQFKSLNTASEYGEATWTPGVSRFVELSKRITAPDFHGIVSPYDIAKKVEVYSGENKISLKFGDRFIIRDMHKELREHPVATLGNYENMFFPVFWGASESKIILQLQTATTPKGLFVLDLDSGIISDRRIPVSLGEILQFVDPSAGFIFDSETIRADDHSQKPLSHSYYLYDIKQDKRSTVIQDGRGWSLQGFTTKDLLQGISGNAPDFSFAKNGFKSRTTTRRKQGSQVLQHSK